MADIVCQELVELVTAYLDGELAEPELSAARAHLAECDDCTTYVEQMEVTARLAATLREHPDDAVVAELLEVFRHR